MPAVMPVQTYPVRIDGRDDPRRDHPQAEPQAEG